MMTTNMVDEQLQSTSTNDEPVVTVSWHDIEESSRVDHGVASTGETWEDDSLVETKSEEQLVDETTLPASATKLGPAGAMTTSTFKAKCSSRGRGRGLRSRAPAIVCGVSAYSKERQLSSSSGRQHIPMSQQQIIESNAMLSNSTVEEVLCGSGAALTGSQSDPTLSASASTLCRQDNRLCYNNRTQADFSTGPQANPEDVMDAYIEKFSSVGYSSSGGCISAKDNLHLTMGLDQSRRPSTLQEAICLYIDYLTYENELRTRISECAVMSPPPPLDFHKEEYYRDVVRRPVSFPTVRFREWLKLYNVDIEITDPDGQTVSQTTFTPTASLSSAAFDQQTFDHSSFSAGMQQPVWNLGGISSAGHGPFDRVPLFARRRGPHRFRAGGVSHPSGWIQDVQSVGTGPPAPSQYRGYQQMMQPYRSAEVRPRIQPTIMQPPASSCYGVNCVMTPQVIGTHDSFVTYEPISADQPHQMYESAQPGRVHIPAMTDLHESSRFQYGVELKKEDHNNSRGALSRGLPDDIEAIMQPYRHDITQQHGYLLKQQHDGSQQRSANDLGRIILNDNYVTTKSSHPVGSHLLHSSGNRQSSYQGMTPEVALSGGRQHVPGFRQSSSIVDNDFSIGYDILRHNEDRMACETIDSNDGMSQRIHVPQLHHSSAINTNYQMMFLPSSSRQAGNDMVVVPNVRQPRSGSGSANEMVAMAAVAGEAENQLGMTVCNGMAGSTIEWQHQESDIRFNTVANLPENAALTCPSDDVQLTFANFNELSASAPAFVGLGFDEIQSGSYRKRNGEPASRDHWSDDVMQWPPSSSQFNDESGSFDDNQVSLEYEPLLKTPKRN